MKTTLITALAIAAAAPALAHADSSFHSHGIELWFGVAAVVALGVWGAVSNK